MVRYKFSLTICRHLGFISRKKLFCVLKGPLIEIANKHLHLPEEAALVLRHHELHLFQGWEEWIRSLAHNLVNQSSARHGSIQVIQDYNAQASNFKLEALSLFRPCCCR